MTDLSREILESWQVRKSKRQKTAFIELIQRHIPEARLEAKGSTRNIVIGDVDSAKLVFGAHYDTCSMMPLPNFITPKNILIYIVYQLSLVLLIFAFAAFAGLVAVILGADGDGTATVTTAALFLGYCFMLFGPANRHTANDNTSGVITLIEIYFSMDPELRKSCAFVFFDKEELGFIGSAAFSRAHKKAMKQKLMVNFDCVSDGDHLMFISGRKARSAFGELLKSSFVPVPGKKIHFEKSSTTFYPSDQIHFPLSVAVASMKRAPIIGYYMNRIHTFRDTIFDERNIELLRDWAINLAKKI